MKNVVLMILGFIVDAQGTHSLWDPFPDEEDRDILEGFRSVITPPDLSSDLFSPNALDFFPPESPDLCVEPMIELAEGNIFAEHHCATPLLDTSTAPLSEDQFNTFLGQLSPQEQRPQVPFILPRIAGEGDNITRENTDKTGRKKRASARYKHVTVI